LVVFPTWIQRTGESCCASPDSFLKVSQAGRSERKRRRCEGSEGMLLESFVVWSHAKSSSLYQGVVRHTVSTSSDG